MKKHIILAALAGTLLVTPGFAQQAPATAPKADAQAAPARQHPGPRHPGKRFESKMSAEGQQIMRDAMRGQRDDADRQQLRTARERINTLTAAEKLDVSALRKAMADERKLVNDRNAERQESLIRALEKLSPADRKAFAEHARIGRHHVEQRMKHRGERDGRGKKAEQRPAQPATTN